MTAAPITALCSRDFYPAHRESGGRRLEEILWAVVHDEEAPTAKSAAAYFQSHMAGGSAQICVDPVACYRCLRNDVIPWGASSAPQLEANLHGFHVEQAGYAAWTLGRWRLHSKTIDRAAYKIVENLPHLPIVWLGVDQLVEGGRTGKLPRGITSHRVISAASRILDPAHASDYTHSDPGLFYPRRLLLRRCRYWRAQLAA